MDPEVPAEDMFCLRDRYPHAVCLEADLSRQEELLTKANTLGPPTEVYYDGFTSEVLEDEIGNELPGGTAKHFFFFRWLFNAIDFAEWGGKNNIQNSLLDGTDGMLYTHDGNDFVLLHEGVFADGAE